MPVSFRYSAFYLAFFAYSGVYVAWFPVYLAARGLGAAEIAWVLALPPLVRIVAPTAWGWLADRAGAHRGVVVFACAANAAGFALLPFVEGFAAIALVMAAASLLAAGALPLVEASTLAHLGARQGGYGPIRLWGSLGFIATVLGGGVWLEGRAPGTLAALLLGCALASLAAALLLPTAGAARAPGPERFALPPGAISLLLSGFCMASAHGALYVFLTLHLRELGYAETFIGFAWTLGVLAEIVVFLALPRLFHRFALSTILAASCALGVLRFLALGWAAEIVWLLALAQVLHAATFGSFHAAAVAAVHRVFPAHARGRGQALFSSASYAAGGAFGALLAGWGWETAGAALAFSLGAAAAALGLFLALGVRRAGF
ncbi:MAG TPA: MFS transporter [Burkholderiales bacterium]|nr:MFS transporter [Burkholderiales bacterium]